MYRNLCVSLLIATLLPSLLFAAENANDGVWTSRYSWNREELERFGSELEEKIDKMHSYSYGLKR